MEIETVKASGSHYQVGLQIGAQCRRQIVHSLQQLRQHLPLGKNYQRMLEASQPYLNATKQVFPQYIEELKGLAEGAEVPFEDVFLSMCEELWETAAWRGCTDMAARGNATLDGSTLVAHTNDLAPDAEEDLVILQIKAEGEPEFLGVSSGAIAYSAGFNAAGVSLTGNQLDNNDIHPGVPRLVMVRALLAAKNISQALSLCLLPQRASSYDNFLADKYGEVYAMEGSATDCEPIYISGDTLAHSNHYVTPRMKVFEANPDEIGNSIMRYNRANRLLSDHYGSHSPELFKTLLADHASYPASICKHQPDNSTIFSIIIQLETLTAWIGKGKPCETEYFTYHLDPYESDPT